jgi:hypothetical protein
MPNHVKNRITVLGADEEVQKVFEFLKGEPYEDGSPRLVDFNKVIPQPSNMFHGGLGEKERQQCAAEGRPNWYDWNIKNWGTKWGAYSLGAQVENSITFETAWSFAEPVAEKLAEIFPDIEITWDWADEDTGCNTGRSRLHKGELWIYSPPNSSEKAYEIAFDLRPYHREDYELVDGKYQYKEDED